MSKKIIRWHVGALTNYTTGQRSIILFLTSYIEDSELFKKLLCLSLTKS